MERSTLKRTVVAVMASVATLASVQTAEATPAHRIDLRWTTDEPTCIDQATLERTVEITLGRPVFHAEASASASIEGAIGPSSTGKGFRARITMRSPSGDVLSERELSTSVASCDRMDESVAVVVALMADNLQEPPAGLHVPETLPRPPTWVTPERAHPSPRAPSSSILEAEVGGAFAIGLLPRPGPGTYLRAALGVGHAALAVAAYGFLPSRTLDEGAGAVINAWAFDLSACYAPVEASSLRVGGCLLLGGGWTDATPVGTADSLSRPLAFAFGGLSIDASVRLQGPLWLHLRPSVWSPFESAQYFFQGRDGSEHTVFKQWVAVPSVSVGIGARAGS